MNETTTLALETVNITIDGQPLAVPKGTTIYQATRLLGIEVPIFCYQDRMPPFGACRVCLVEVEKMPKLQTACTLVATEGMVIRTQSQIAKEGREAILELLLINHPLDCPICDRGGECPLQDNALKFGPEKSRFTEEKRHFTKALPVGPVLMLDRERCIMCARCVRFSDLIAGDHALEFIDRGFKSEVGTVRGKALESKFIGNTIMICPVGALTSQVYRFRARPWDNQSIRTTCTLCPVGCSQFIDTRDGEIMRTRSCENRQVNDIWLCDKGWFGYEFTYHPDRLKEPLIKKNGSLLPASWEEALALIAEKMLLARTRGKIAALGGDPLTIEENYLFQKLMREGCGTAHIDHRIGKIQLDAMDPPIIPGMRLPIEQCEKLERILLLGVDLTEEFPLLWLRLRQAINAGAQVLFLGHYPGDTATYYSQKIIHTPGQDIEILEQHESTIREFFKENSAVFIGSQYTHTQTFPQYLKKIVEWTPPHVTINILDAHENSLGALWAGMHPTLDFGFTPAKKKGLSYAQLIDRALEGWDILYIAGANPSKKMSRQQWKTLRNSLDFLIVQDLFLTETARDADVVLPTLSYLEKEGTFMNIEGRLCKVHVGKRLPEGPRTDEDIFRALALRMNIPEFEMSEQIGNLLKQERIILPAIDVTTIEPQAGKNPSSQGLRATFGRLLFDSGVRMMHNTHLSKLAKQSAVRLHPFEGAKRNLKSGDRISITHKDSGFAANLKFDKNISEGTIWIPLGMDQVDVYELNTPLFNGLPIEVHKL